MSLKARKDDLSPLTTLKSGLKIKVENMPKL